MPRNFYGPRHGRDTEVEMTVGQDHPWHHLLLKTRARAQGANTSMEIVVAMEGYAQVFSIRELQVRDDPYVNNIVFRVRAIPVADPSPIPATPDKPQVPHIDALTKGKAGLQ